MICADFALLRLWKAVGLRVAEWRTKFSNLQDGKDIVSSTEETSANLRLLEKGDLIVCMLMQPHLNHVADSGLSETLKHCIGYYHGPFNKQGKRIEERLFQSGAIQAYEGKEHRYVDYPVMDVLQMTGQACRPTEDDKSRFEINRDRTIVADEMAVSPFHLGMIAAYYHISSCFRLMAKSALSLDEFCINFADEVMHSYFIRHILEDCRLQQPADRRWCLLGIHHDYGQLAMFIASAWRAAQYTLNQETR
ncbi:predicted protein [Postia placenta Mad-698-R]|nr:predicted protein [Postia placenta Mad-698-R]